MKKRFPSNVTGLVLPVAVIGLGAAVWIWMGSGTPAGPKFLPESFNLSAERAHWVELIGRSGAEAAYREFKESYRSKDLKSQHIGAHIFGDVLYAKEGLEGFLVCDEAFAFGCYHIFLTRALAEQGLEAVTMLHNACRDKFGSRTAGCEHGIGHGLLEYFGYEPDGLRLALEACPPAEGAGPFVGCRSGVFMEYYSRVSFDETHTALEWRELDPADPYAPCPAVRDEFKRPCYAQLGLWWDHATDGDYLQMGSWCRDVPEPAYKGLCFFSLGLFGATLSEYDEAKTLARCEEMPDAGASLLCRAGAYRSFRGSPASADHAEPFCGDLDAPSAERCFALRPELL